MPEKQELQRLTKLLQLLSDRFSRDELRTLCFYLGVDYDSLPGEGKTNKARELVAYLERRDRIHDLIRVGKQLRPELAWEDAPQDRREYPTIFPDLPPEGLLRDYDELSWMPERLGLDPQQVHIIKRQDVIEQIKNILEDPSEKRIVFLYGEPQIGKTFVLDQLRETLQDQYVPVLVHLNGWASIRELSDFIYELAVSIQLELESLCPELDIQSFTRGPKHQASAEFRRFIHDLSQSVCAEGKFLLLMFDELEYLAREETHERICKHLAGFVDQWSQKVRFVFSGSGDLLDWLKQSAMAELLSKGQWVCVDCFPGETSRALVNALTAPYFTLAPEAVDLIVYLANGHPSLLTRVIAIVLRHWKSEWRERNIVGKDDLGTIIGNIYIELSPKTTDIWYRLSPQEQLILEKISQTRKVKFGIDEVIIERSYYVKRDLQQLVGRRILRSDPQQMQYAVRLGILVNSISYGVLLNG